MAKQANDNGANPGFEARLRAAVDKLCANMQRSDYRHVALGRIFLKYISDTFEAKRAALLKEDNRRRGDALDDHVPDTFLAAAAATRGLAVVTRNTGEFRNTGVETVDPWAAARA
ncbi:MAG: hypothetical protein F4Y04_06420 [Chloroflexi bacterium]|nr:hypothetical protein [Chloroflexota bacterium]